MEASESGYGSLCNRAGAKDSRCLRWFCLRSAVGQVVVWLHADFLFWEHRRLRRCVLLAHPDVPGG